MVIVKIFKCIALGFSGSIWFLMPCSLYVAFQPNQSANNVGGLPRERVELPSNARGVPTPEALGIILRHAQQLLRVHANAALDVHTTSRKLF